MTGTLLKHVIVIYMPDGSRLQHQVTSPEMLTPAKALEVALACVNRATHLLTQIPVSSSKPEAPAGATCA